MNGLLAKHVSQTHGTSANVRAEDKLLGLLGDVDTLEEEEEEEEEAIDVEAELAEIRATVESSEETYTWTYENGRRYPSSELGHYYMPNDEPEIQRLNEQHWVLTQVKGGSLHSAPLPKRDGLKILDLGCGSGIWCIQMAEDYPTARIYGMDVSPIQPKSSPAGVEWVTLDVEATWPFPENHFDLIHLSLVHGCVRDWDTMLTKIMRHLAPGGYVEHQEFSLCRQYLVDEQDKPIPLPDRLDELPPFFRWNRLMEQAGLARGRPLQLGPHLASMQSQAGLENVTETVIKHKWGGWPSDPKERSLGTRTMLQTITGMEGFTTVMFTKSLGWNLEDTENFIVDVKRDMKDDSLRKVIDLHVVYGRKPIGQMETKVKEPNEGSSVAAALVDGPGLQLGGVVVAAIGATFAAAFAHWVLSRKP